MGFCCWNHPIHPEQNTLPNILMPDLGNAGLELQPVCWSDVIWRAGTRRALLTCNPKPLSTCLSILAVHGRKIHCSHPPSMFWGWNMKGPGFPPRKENLECFLCGFWGVFELGPPLLLAGADSCPEEQLWPLCPFSTSFFQGKTHKTQTLLPSSPGCPWLSPQNTLLNFGGNALGAPQSFQGVSHPLSSLVLPGLPLLGFFFWTLPLSSPSYP